MPKSFSVISFKVECSISSSTNEKYEIFKPSVRIAQYFIPSDLYKAFK